MLTTLILGAALIGQAPRPTEAELAARTAQLKADIQARALAQAQVRRAREAAMTPEARKSRQLAWDAARYRRQAQEQMARENRAIQLKAEQAAQAKLEAQQRAEAERLIPYQLQAQRQAFQQQAEMERLRLEAERNQILDRGLSRIYRGQYTAPQTQPMWWPR